MFVFALAAGCAGNLDDPDRFLSHDACPPGTYVPRDIFQKTCGTSTCHSGAGPAGSLDLASPGVAERLMGKPSTTCPGHELLSGPDAGFLLDKVHEDPACGAQMPLGLPPLTQADLACIQDWVAQVYADGGTP